MSVMITLNSFILINGDKAVNYAYHIGMFAVALLSPVATRTSLVFASISCRFWCSRFWCSCRLRCSCSSSNLRFASTLKIFFRCNIDYLGAGAICTPKILLIYWAIHAEIDNSYIHI